MPVNRRLIIFLFLLLTVSVAVAQPPVSFKVTVDRDSILIGQPVNVVLSVTGSEAFMNGYNWITVPDTINHFEVISRDDVNTKASEGNTTVTQHVTVTSFDSGKWVFPSLTTGGFTLLGGKEVAVNTVTVPPNDDYRDIHDIEEVKTPFNYRPWLIGAAILFTLAIIAWLVIATRRKQKLMPRQTAQKLQPIDEALKELDALRAYKWPEAGEYNRFHTKLDDIFRMFLHRQYHTSALYQTNEEVLLQLKQGKMAGGYTTEIAQALRLNNFVKFAGYEPGSTQSYEAWQTVRQAIEKTKTETTAGNAV